jgi:leader peptidase (prepilin peptidase)/N-methyltransferase
VELYAIVLLVGLVVGSFLNVCIYRLPQGMSIIWPASHCPHCQTPIPFYLNVPVLSYVLLRGRCRFCNEAIGWRYPVVELLTGLLFVLIVQRHGVGGDAALHLVLASGLLVIVVSDWRSLTIPRAVVVLLAAAGVGLLALVDTPSFLDAFWGLIVGAGLLLLVAVGYRYARAREGMGIGDVFVAAILGMYFGWTRMPMLLLFASVTALAYAVFCLWKSKKTLTDPIPFGSFLASWGIIFCVL